MYRHSCRKLGKFLILRGRNSTRSIKSCDFDTVKSVVTKELPVLFLFMLMAFLCPGVLFWRFYPTEPEDTKRKEYIFKKDIGKKKNSSQVEGWYLWWFFLSQMILLSHHFKPPRVMLDAALVTSVVSQLSNHYLQL